MGPKHIFYITIRAESEVDKNAWIELLEDAKADAVEGRMKHRAGSLPSIGSRSLHSSSSQRRTTQSVKTKLEELKTYREILCSQVLSDNPPQFGFLFIIGTMTRFLVR